MTGRVIPAADGGERRQAWPGQELRPGARVRTGDTVAPHEWCALFLRRCGLTFRDSQVPTVVRLIEEQMQARGVTSAAAYYTQLAEEREGGTEWTALLDGVLNHETSFFRHPASFDALRTTLLPDLLAQRGRGAYLSFWSAGCSTGQETYSLAMLAMANTDVDGRFIVWGSDLSRKVIDVARRARYGPRAMIGVPAEYQKRFFLEYPTERGPEYAVTEALRQRVRFMSGNLLSDTDFGPRHDVIFCHNVLIYFAPEAASRLIVALAGRLRPGGYLLLGPGEGFSDQPPGLEPLHVPGVRGFRRSLQGPTERRS